VLLINVAAVPLDIQPEIGEANARGILWLAAKAKKEAQRYQEGDFFHSFLS
jgi:hypothetical protein